MKNYIKPMLTKLVEKPFDGDEWLFEIKFDGYRAVAELNKQHVRLYSRNGLDFGQNYPSVVKALKKLNLHAVIDGEIIAIDKEGCHGFQVLQESQEDSSIRQQYYVFDLIELNGENTRDLPLIERKKKLHVIFKENDVIRYSEHEIKNGKKLFNWASKVDFEGIIAKRIDSSYSDGTRNGNWLKIKHHKSEEAVIIGYTEPKGSRHHFGSLLLAEYDDNKLTYVGNTGTGFTESTIKNLSEKMKPLEIEDSPIEEPIKRNRHITWLKPKLVCNVKYAEKTKGGNLRQAVFLGLRKDKSPKEVKKEDIN